MIWKKKHPKTLQANYAGAKSFHSVKEQVFSWYDIESDLLSEINLHFIKNICTYLGINTTLVDSRTLDLQGDRNERLVDACQKLGADTYLSGPSAQAYLDTDLFRQSDISVEWMDYAGYPPYEQRYPPFVHNVSVIDLIFAEGKNASNFLGHR